MAQRQNEGPKQGAAASSPGPFLLTSLFTPSRSGCSTRSARRRTESYRCDTPLSRPGSGSQPVPVGNRRAAGGGCGAGGGAAWLWRTGADLQRLAEAVGRRCSCQDSWGELARQRGAEGKGCVRRAVGVFGVREDFETGSSS